MYTVCLTVSSTCGSDTLTRTGYVTVAAGGAYSTTLVTYTYDALNRLTQAEYADGTSYQYEYDEVGNRKALTTTAGTTTYTYVALSRLNALRNSVPACLYSGNL